MASKYRPRLVDGLLERALHCMGALVVEGPKGCGKTTTCEQQAKSQLYLGSTSSLASVMDLLAYNPSGVLSGATPRLFDEWQVIPQLWDEIRFAIDHRQKVGQFILTGSAVPGNREEIVHTGTGRFAWITMHTMTLFESGESNGQVSLKELFAGQHDVVAQNCCDIGQVAFATCRGGWPQSLTHTDESALEFVRQYLEAVIKTDVSRVDGSKKDPEKTRGLLRAYARNLGSQASVSTLRLDVVSNEDTSFTDKTCQKYLNAFRDIYVIENVNAWNPNLRSRTAIRTAPTRYFTDPAIAAAALRIGPNDLLQDPATFGFLFENLCIRDLKVYAQALDGDIYHFRDKSNLECDAVLHRRDGSFGLIEIKLGGDHAIEYGATNLKKLSEKIDTNHMPKPSFLMVLVATGEFAYKRKDGVLVVPISCLRH